MKTCAHIITLLVTLLATSGWAQSSGGFKVKNLSAFNVAGSSRNPFWPIGYVPGIPGSQTPNSQAQQAPKAALKAEDFTLTSISSFQGARMAMVSGKSVIEGQLVNLNVSGQRMKVQIVSITDGAVTLRCMGQEITVSQKRPELQLMSKPAPPPPVLHSSEE